MRNRNWLKPEYFECLARRQVAHVYNSWDAMPPVVNNRLEGNAISTIASMLESG
jgi:uncharacterized radical SAM superfamily Fe-S cluster-containing enzyme